MIWGNLVLVQAQALVVGFLAAIFAMVMGWIPQGKWNVQHGLILCSSSMLTASLASFVLGMTYVAMTSVLMICYPTGKCVVMWLFRMLCHTMKVISLCVILSFYGKSIFEIFHPNNGCHAVILCQRCDCFGAQKGIYTYHNKGALYLLTWFLIIYDMSYDT